MLLKSSSSISSGNLFYSSLSNMLDNHDPLIALADSINWKIFEDEFAKLYSKHGRPAKPIRLMVGLLLLKQLENLSDEEIVLEWKRNPYYQYFCGFNEFQITYPCHSTELVKFRQRIGVKGVEFIFTHSVVLHGKNALEKQVIVDTTVQEKNITYPTDGKLAIKMINHLHKLSKKENLSLRRTYIKEIKEHRISLRFFKHPKKIKKARAAIKRLKTIVGILIRDISRLLSQEQLKIHQDTFTLFEKVRAQQIKDKNKILSLHEQHIYAITKGKDHKKYEYGTKASIVSTIETGIIVGVSSHKTNMHDSKTLEDALSSATLNTSAVVDAIKSNSNKSDKSQNKKQESITLSKHILQSTCSKTDKHSSSPIEEAICDRGYRGVKEVYGITISIPSTPLKKDTPNQIQQKRYKFKRRASIEPIIGHLKSDYRLSRNYLKGYIGDQMNLLLAATAWNLKKWMNIYFYALFSSQYNLIIEAQNQISIKTRIIYELLKIKQRLNQK